MKIEPYIQGESALTTLDAIEQLFQKVDPQGAIFCFAYATFSGCAEFQRRFGDAFWQARNTSWLFGIDYGRTAPAALSFVASKKNATVKVANGSTVVVEPGFIPTQDFHMKACFAWNEATHKYGIVAGSGNFSRNGLGESTECGTLMVARDQAEYNKIFASVFDDVRALWESATALNVVLAPYEERWSRSIFRAPAIELQSEEPAEDQEDEEGAEELPQDLAETHRFFWIDAGYVTRNRGPQRPGNQIDLPRGVHRFFGMPTDPNQQKNTPIGDITFKFTQGDVTRALRLGNNMMEKITLPIPEDHGIGAYDGTILEFERVQGGFKVRTFEPNEYLFAFGRDDDFSLYRMGSGRPFGFRGAPAA